MVEMEIKTNKGSVAQRYEQKAFNFLVVGSIPTRPTYNNQSS